MDTTQLTHVSLCAGYGGIDLGLRRVLPGLRTIAYSEIEEYACGLLAARMESGHLDPAPIWSDLKTFPFSDFHGCVDILSGGYPCQPFSAAGKRRGTDDPRHLWPFIAEGIRLCQPRICFFENVEGHISLGLRDVLGDLERLGYQATWGIFSASEVGAPHQRKRIFILAYRNGAGLEGSIQARIADPFGREKPSDGHAGPGRDNGPKLAHGHGCGWGQNPDEGELRADLPIESSRNCRLPGQAATQQVWPARPGEPQHAWEPPRVVANAHRRGLEGAGAQRGRAEDAVGSDRESSEVVANAFRNGRSKAERDAATMGGEERSEEGCKSESGRVAPSSDGGSSMADSSIIDRQRGAARTGRRSGSEIDAAGGDEEQQREVEPALGGDVDGAASRLDYADLSIACHNRTDELRLLGNGVVPATAALAFRTLLTQLDHDLR